MVRQTTGPALGLVGWMDLGGPPGGGPTGPDGMRQREGSREGRVQQV